MAAITRLSPSTALATTNQQGYSFVLREGEPRRSLSEFGKGGSQVIPPFRGGDLWF